MTWRVPLTLASLVLHNDIHLYIRTEESVPGEARHCDT